VALAKRTIAAGHPADAAYVCGSNLFSSRARQIDPVDPPYRDSTRQAKAKGGFDVARFKMYSGARRR
jgi:hypothetical protein